MHLIKSIFYMNQVLDIIEQYMMTTGYEYRRLDGSTSMKQRMILVREFNNEPDIFVFLISTKLVQKIVDVELLLFYVINLYTNLSP